MRARTAPPLVSLAVATATIPDPLTQALAPLARLLAPYLVPLLAAHLGAGANAPRAFSQIDGQRPPGVGRPRYLRAWRRGRDAADPECRADGRARLMMDGAWARWGASPARTKPKLALVAPMVSAEDELLAELGAKRVGGRS